MVEEGGLTSGVVLAQGAGVAQTLTISRSSVFCLTKMGEEDDGYLMVLGVNMGLEFVKRVCIVITGIASYLNGVGSCQHGQLPLVTWTSFSDVVVQRQPRQVLVCLTVKLEVGLQICFVGT